MKSRLIVAVESLLLTGILFLTGCSVASDEIPPADVTKLAAVPQSAAVALSWTNPSDRDFNNVELVIVAADNSTPKTLSLDYGVSSFTVPNLTNNLQYTITVRSVDASGNRSQGVSCSAVPNDANGPANVYNLSVVYGEGEAVLSWTNPRDSKFAGVVITVTNNDMVETSTTADATSTTATASTTDTTAATTTDTTTTPTTSTASAETTTATKSTTSSSATTATATTAETAAPAATTTAAATTPATSSTATTATTTATTTTATTEQSDAEIAATLASAEQERNVSKTVKTEQKTRTITIENSTQELYTVSGLTSGASYTFTVSTFDTDKRFSKGLSKTGKMPVETAGLKFTLSSDGSSYILTGFTGDDSVNQMVTPEETAGAVTNPISVTVFSKYNNKPVTAIASDAFRNCRRVVQVTLPSTITRIGANAFEGCTALANLTIPEGTTIISDGAFWNCVSLAWIVIPKSVTEIGLGATLGDAALKHIFYTGTSEQWNLLMNNTRSGNSCLTGTVARFLNKPAEIRYGYDGYSTIEFQAPKEVAGLTAEPGLSHVTLSWVNPSDEDFAGTYISAKPADGSLSTTFTISSADVDSYVATGLTNGQSYTFSVVAFDKVGNCSAEKETNSVVCQLVEKSDVLGFNYHVSEDGASCIIDSYDGNENVVVVPERMGNLPVTEITNNAFNAETIENVVLPKTITVISEDAFSNDISLKNVFYAGGEESWNAIDGATSLLAVPHWNFTYTVEDTTAPAEVTDVSVRKGDKKLVIEFEPPEDSDYLTTEITCASDVKKIIASSFGVYTVLGLTNGTTYTFTIKTRDIYGNVSEGITVSAEAGEIPAEGVTSEGFQYRLVDDAHDEMSGTSYEIYGYTASEKEPADGVSLVVPEKIHDVPVTQIGENAFVSCASLKSVYIPKTVTVIKSLASCKGLFSLVVAPENKTFFLNADGTISYRRVVGAKAVAQVLHSVSGVVDFTGTNVVALDPGALGGCSYISSVILPRTVKEIGANTFMNCSALKTIIIPRSVKSIGDGAFNGCSKFMLCNYTGTKEEWKKIDISSKNNSALLNAQKTFEYNK